MTTTEDHPPAAAPLDPTLPSVRTVVTTQLGLADGRPVMIPGVPGPRVRKAIAPVVFTAPVPVFDRQRTEHEWEGGGAPQYRNAGARSTATSASWWRRLVRRAGE